MMRLVEETRATTRSMILERMPQQPGFLGSSDDWTGVTSAAERRKVQNRLNQRMYRKRKRDGQTIGPPTASRAIRVPQNLAESLKAQGVSRTHIKEQHHPPDLWQIFHSAVKSQVADRGKLATVAKSCPVGPREAEKTILEFKKWVQSQAVGSPGADNLFVLVKFNVFRALVSNCRNLGIAVHDTLDDDASSPFPESIYPSFNSMSVPAALWPTNLQRELSHHPWIDTLPIPRMRDNLLKAGDSYDAEGLCTDLIGCGSSDSNRIGMIIWGEPWDPAGWEVTVEFLQHWGWTIRGCHQLAAATNSWRKRRGEKPLNFEGIRCHELAEHRPTIHQ